MSGLSSRSDDFKRKVDSHVSALVDSYRTLLRKGQVGDKMEQQMSLQVDTAVSNISLHSNALLDQINELRLALVVLPDEDEEKQEQKQEKN
jgi:hypothetical protein